MISKRWGMCCIVAALVASANIFAADQADEVPFEEGKEPPACKPGEGWCLVTKPATYKTVSKQVEVQKASFYMEAVPAKFETKPKQIAVAPEKSIKSVVPAKFKTEQVKVLVKPEHKVIDVIPAQFEWAEQEVEVRSGYETINVSNATFKTVTEQVQVSPASTYWKKEDGKDCYCLCEKPAKFVTVTKEVPDAPAAESKVPVAPLKKLVKVQKLVADAKAVEKVVPAEYITIDKEVVEAPAAVAANTVPAKFETIQEEIEVAKSTTRKIDIPAKFETVTESVLDQPARMVWRKTKCDCGTIVSKYKEVPGTDMESLLKSVK